MLESNNYFEAFAFYRAYILDPYHVKLGIRQDYQFKKSTVSSGDWELFGAILTGQIKSNQTYGHDLDQFEVKSAVDRKGFEYQYHRNTGEAKLQSEPLISHLFVSYSNHYLDVDVRVVDGAELKDLFEGWLPGLLKAYKNKNRNDDAQRYRKKVPYRTVVSKGVVVFKIRNGKVVEPTLKVALDQ